MPVAAGVLATVTVLVWDPQPASEACREQGRGEGSSHRSMVFAARRLAPGIGRVAVRIAAQRIRSGWQMSTQPPQQQGSSPQRGGPRRSRSETARTGGIVVLAILMTLFAVLNLEKVKVNWIFGSGHAPLDHRDRDLAAGRDRAHLLRRPALEKAPLARLADRLHRRLGADEGRQRDEAEMVR